MRRRLAPDDDQVQIIIGSLLGDGRIEGRAGARRLYVSEAAHRAGYVRWKYERLAGFADAPPVARDGRVGFGTIAHPFFDDLAPLLDGSRARLRALLRPLGRAVSMTDERGACEAAVQEPAGEEKVDLIRE